MGLLDRLSAAGNALFRPQNANTLTTSQDLERAWLHYTEPTLSGAPVNFRTSMGVGAVASCVRYIRDTLSHLPLVVFVREGDTITADTGHPLYSLLRQKPNEWQTAMEWRELLIQDVELRGNAYALKVMGLGGRITELIRLHPDTVMVKQNEDLSLEYQVTRPDGRRTVYPRQAIFHLRGPGDDGVTGFSTIRQYRETIGNAMALRTHGSKFFRNGAKPGLAFEVREGHTMTPESRKELKEEIAEEYSGSENAFKTMIIPTGLELKPVSISMEDAQFVEWAKLTNREIYGVFGMPPHKGGDLDRATFTNIEHQSIEVVQDAIAPRAARVEQAIHRDLLDEDPTRFVMHDLERLLRGDAKSRAEALQIERRNGIRNPNEWRQEVGLNPRTDEGADKYIIEGNMRYDDGTQLAAPGAAAPADPPNPEE